MFAAVASAYGFSGLVLCFGSVHKVCLEIQSISIYTNPDPLKSSAEKYILNHIYNRYTIWRIFLNQVVSQALGTSIQKNYSLH